MQLILAILGGLTIAAPTILASEATFAQTIKPFLASYCAGCHSGQTAAAQLDLRQYNSADTVLRDYIRWNLVSDKLASGEMPPKEVKQPPAEVRKAVIAWYEGARDAEARKHAGDPGIVLARRLNNAEYNYTIRDLTGVDLRPAREFPVDPANPAGFDNSGESLTMSAALLGKCLQAAREVSNHMVLNLDGIAFAPHPMLVETDREKYAIQRIVDFYDRQPTDFADYFEAAWRFKHRAALGRGRASLADTAKESGVSGKYLAMVWGALEGSKEEIGPMARLQGMWRELPGLANKDAVRKGCVEMRDFVVNLRKITFELFKSPTLFGLSASSQPLMNWKLKQFATHRRDFDRSALQVEGEAAPSAPLTLDRGAVAGGRDMEAVKAYLGAIMEGRREHPSLAVPAGERGRYETAFERFSRVFPDAFYIRERGRFYPVDTLDKGRLLSAGFHNVMGYYRDDLPLRELILDEPGKQHLERLWQEFEVIGDYTTRTYIQYYFNQSGEVTGRGRESGTERPSAAEVSAEAVIMGLKEQYLAKAADAKDPVVKQAIEEHFNQVNATMRWVERARREAEPRQLDALLRFAARAYRRPLTSGEREGIGGYYRKLRGEMGMNHEEAMRDSIASVLVSPHFLYRVRPAAETAPLPGHEVANRLSYFLWSSMPDRKLMELASSGALGKPETLAGEAARMLKDERTRGLAAEFAGNWLEFRRFEDHNAVDRERFPSFDNALRQAMFEEPVRFIEDVIRNDRPLLDLLYARHTFVNPALARHYGAPAGEGWVRLDNAAEFGRGGLLPMAVFLTQNSPGLRTSPVKRGYWVARRVLGEAIPPPPASVPELPEDEAKLELPLPQMLARHRDNAACASCHARFDSFGLAFEGYGPIGEKRENDLAGRPVHTRATFPGGSEAEGLVGLQNYIRAHREKDFLDNVSRKLLVYALGRSLIISDELLIDRMKTRLAANQYRMSALVETIVTSPQFRNRRMSAMLEERKGQ
ncbi:MAG: DUF1592 domain-containing protein [Acidimicrobiia bacterium]|nr:DUF1592 domain-containing protein [Acidimicrobiia bacterium]